MEKKTLLYEGKAKKVWSTDDPDVLVVEYKDDATAFNGKKRGTIAGKGVINNRMSNHLMKLLETQGVPTHFIDELDDRQTAVRRVKIIPTEVIVRNIAAGSFAIRYGVEEGGVFAAPTVEFSYKNDGLNDPLLADDHIYALGLASKEEVALIRRYSLKINDVLRTFWKKRGVTLVDFKIEFGRLDDGKIILADEISPDTCRLWDSESGEKLDKDRFRRDLGNVEEAYAEIMRRLKEEI